jgi:hypothetical protein
MLNRITRSLHLQNLARFSKKKKKNQFVFKSIDKTKEKEATISKSTQTEPIQKDPISSSFKDPTISDIQRKEEIAKKIFASNEMAKNYGTVTVLDWLKHGGKIEDFACEKLKNYPYHIDHWNPEKEGYVAAERDEDRMKRSVDGYNNMVGRLREEIEIQKVYQSKLENLQREYLKGTPGIQ